MMDICFSLVKAFLVGGLLCTVGQLWIDLTKFTPAKILVCYVLCGVLLGALGWYEPLVDFAGYGARIPLTGFGYGLVNGTKKAVEESGLLGAFTGPLSSASVGITAAMAWGLLLSFVAKPKPKE